MTQAQKTDAVEAGYQLKRDFKFHLGEEVDLTLFSKLIASGNAGAVEKELSRLTVLYADKIKRQANANHC